MVDEMYKGFEIVIEQDEDPEDPRKSWDNFGTMACAHRRYNLGDEKIPAEDFGSWGEVERWLRKEHGAVLTAPLYLYDHSGLRMKIGSFVGLAQHAEWDSGQVGFIYVTKEQVLKEYGVKRLTKPILAKAMKVLEGEVGAYDQYLSGDVWCVQIKKQDETLDSLCGVYGSDWAIKEGKQMVDGHLRYKREQSRERTKAKKFQQYWRGYPEDWGGAEYREA